MKLHAVKLQKLHHVSSSKYFNENLQIITELVEFGSSSTLLRVMPNFIGQMNEVMKKMVHRDYAWNLCTPFANKPNKGYPFFMVKFGNHPQVLLKGMGCKDVTLRGYELCLVATLTATKLCIRHYNFDNERVLSFCNFLWSYLDQYIETNRLMLQHLRPIVGFYDYDCDDDSDDDCCDD